MMSLRLSHDGKKAVTGSFDKSIIVWDIDDSGFMSVDSFLERHKERVWCIDFNDKEGILVSGSTDKKVIVWTKSQETQKYAFDHKLEGHTKQVYSVALNSTAKLLASGSEDQTIRIWRKGVDGSKTFEYIETLTGHEGKTYSLAFSSDSKFLVSGNQDRTVKIWAKNSNQPSYQISQTIKEHGDLVRGVRLSGDDMTLVSTSESGEVFIWTRKSPGSYLFTHFQKIVDDHKKGVYVGKINKDGTMMVTVSNDKTAIVYKKNRQTRTFQKDQILEVNGEGIWALDLSPDDSKIIVGTSQRTIALFKRKSAREKFFQCYKNVWGKLSIYSISMNKAGDMVVAATQDQKIRIWIKDKMMKKFVHHQTLQEHTNAATCVIFNQDESGLISGASDKTIKTWDYDRDTRMFSVVQTLEGHTDRLKELALTSDGKLLVSASNDYTIRLWLRKKGKSLNYEEFQTLKGHKDRVIGCCVTGDGSTIASGSADQTIIIWRRDHNSEEFTQNQILRGHTDEVSKVLITEDGTTIFSTSDDATIRMWKLDTHAFHMVAVFKFDYEVFEVLYFKNYIIAGLWGSGAAIALTSGKLEYSLSAFKNEYRSASILNKAFSEYELDVLMKVLLEGLPRSEEAKEKKQGVELLKLHTEVNPLLWFCLMESHKFLREALKVWDYEEWIYEDCKELDPFSYSFETGNQDLISVWAEYFEENPSRLTVNRLETFNKLIGSNNPDMQSFGISKLKINTALSKGIEPIDVYTIEERRGFASVKSNQVIMSTRIQQEFKKKENKEKPGVKVSGKSACIGLSPDLSRLLTFLKRVDNLTIDNKMKLRPVVMTIFDMYRPAFLIQSGLNLVAKFLLFTIVIFQKQHLYLVIPFFVIYSMMLLYELIDLFNNGFHYFNSIFNYFDFLLYPSAMGLVAFVLVEKYEFLEDQFNNFWVFLLLYLALTRAVSMLRILDPIRYLIMMILRVYLDMTPFFVVLSFYIIGTGSLNILISLTNKLLGEGEEGPPRYGLTLDQLRLSSDVIYNWGYGGWEFNSEMNQLNFWFYIHTGIFIGLVMFNLLIAIISGTYEQFTEDKLMIDLQEVIGMLLEMAEYLNFWRKVREGIFGVKESDRIYLHFLIPTEEANEIQGLIDEFEELKETVYKNQEEVVDKVEVIQSDVKRVEKIQNEVRSNQEDMKKKIDTILEYISNQKDVEGK